MKIRQILIYSILLILLSSCGETEKVYKLWVINTLEADRKESLQIQKSDFGKILCEHFSRFAIRDTRNDSFLPVQFMDKDLDGILDYLIFQPEMKSGETALFEILTKPGENAIPQPSNRTFSRFVPERIDDYAWENDKVAFRSYGPAAQEMVEKGLKGGIISVGFDCWLKRVDYPIINKWYHKALQADSSYHTDWGEGLDDFHVGSSLGCGATGFWDADQQKLYTSNNFTAWETISEGPLRTRFEFDYDPWDYPGGSVVEKKIISLDMGSNLMRVELQFSPEETPEIISAGITLHEKDGSILVDESRDSYSYWQPHGDSELGMGIVVEKKYQSGYTEYLVEKKDLSHLFVHMKPIQNRLVYYTGFGWKKSGQFANQSDWVAYLREFGSRIGSPLEHELILK